MIALGRLQECAAILEALQRVPLIEVEARLIAATVTSGCTWSAAKVAP